MGFVKNLAELDNERIFNIVQNLDNISNGIIYKNYFRILEFVKRNKTNHDAIDLIGISHTVYGWMPTMFDKTDVSIIENEKDISWLWENIISGSLDDRFLGKIKSLVNNSIRGGSKLLHFINPDNYAIFDQNVYKSITDGENREADFNIQNFKLYICKLKELANDTKNMEKIKTEFKKNNAYDDRITNLRFIEMCLYFDGKKK